jgi:flagellar biosynthetic protein FliQ
MSADQAIELLTRLIWSAALISAPLLAATLIVGLIISILQVATQLQEATLSYVPKLIAAALILVAAGPWMLHTLMNFSTYMFKLIPALG